MTTTSFASATLDRREVVATLVQRAPQCLVVSGLGSSTYDLFAAGDRDRNFYLWGAMGGSISLGLGLALARKDRQVVVITGDGECLMGIGSFATVGGKQPRNLSVVVLDNGHFGETGMQRSHTSLGTSLVQVARACGIEDAIEVDEVAQADEIARRVKAGAGPLVAQVFIGADEPPRALPPRDGVFVKNRFRAALGLAPF